MLTSRRYTCRKQLNRHIGSHLWKPVLPTMTSIGYRSSDCFSYLLAILVFLTCLLSLSIGLMLCEYHVSKIFALVAVCSVHSLATMCTVYLLCPLPYTQAFADFRLLNLFCSILDRSAIYFLLVANYTFSMGNN